MFFVLLILLFFPSCGGSNDLTPEQIKETTMFTDKYDSDILLIEDNAQNSLSTFFRNLNRANSRNRNFYVKYPFLADADSGIRTEQVWLTGIYYENGNYYGTIANSPMNISSLKKDDKVIFSTDSVTDWMYIHNGKIIGGQSIKYLLENIPEEQRNDQQKKILQMF